MDASGKRPGIDMSGVRDPGEQDRSSEKGKALKTENIFELQDLSVFYDDQKAVDSVSMEIQRNEITALIGPSGCGKSTLIRCLNRMNDLIPTARSTARSSTTTRTSTARRSTRSRCASGSGWSSRSRTRSRSRSSTTSPSARGSSGMDNVEERVEHALERAALWDEVKDRLDSNAYGMSGGQQQRLCIARASPSIPT